MNLKSCLSLFVCARILATFSGCTSAPKLNSEFDPSVDFTGYKSFAVIPFPKSIPNTDPGLLLRITPAAKAAVESTMAAKGYTQVANLEEADIAVLVHGKSVPKTNVSGGGFDPVYGAAWYGGYPYASFGVSSVHVDNYDEGTLIVEVWELKPGADNQIWVGWSTGRIQKDTSTQAANVAERIRLLLGKYPEIGMTASAAAMGSK
jgi:hypothetical protein